MIARLWYSARHFFRFGQLLLDRVAILISGGSKFKLVSTGEEHIRNALERGKGAIIVSAHFGNWQGAAHLLGGADITRINILAFEGEAERMRKFFGRFLTQKRFSVINADDSLEGSLQIIAALRRNEIVAIHGDRCLESAGIPCEFLGATAHFPLGPYVLASLSGAPVIHSFSVREKTGHYSFLAYPPITVKPVSRHERRKQFSQYVSLFVQRLTLQVRRHPFQWNNFFDFWGEYSDNTALL